MVVLPPHFGRMFAIDSVASPSRMRPMRLDLESLPLGVDVMEAMEVLVMAVAVALMFGVISQQSSSAGTFVEVAPVLAEEEEEEEEEEAASFQPTDVTPSKPMFVPKVGSTGYSGPFTPTMVAVEIPMWTWSWWRMGQLWGHHVLRWCHWTKAR